MSNNNFTFLVYPTYKRPLLAFGTAGHPSGLAHTLPLDFFPRAPSFSSGSFFVAAQGPCCTSKYCASHWTCFPRGLHQSYHLQISISWASVNISNRLLFISTWKSYKGTANPACQNWTHNSPTNVFLFLSSFSLLMIEYPYNCPNQKPGVGLDALHSITHQFRSWWLSSHPIIFSISAASARSS